MVNSLFKLGSIQRRGNIHPFSHLANEFCRCNCLASSVFVATDLLVDCCCFMLELTITLLDMHAILRKSWSNFFHMSRDSSNIFSRTWSKLSQDALKSGSSKKKSLIVMGTLFSDIMLTVALLVALFVVCCCDVLAILTLLLGCLYIQV